MIRTTRDIFLFSQKLNLSDRSTNILVKHWKSTNIQRIISGCDIPRETFEQKEVLEFLSTYPLTKLARCGIHSAKEIKDKAQRMLAGMNGEAVVMCSNGIDRESGASHDEPDTKEITNDVTIDSANANELINKYLYKVILNTDLSFVQFMYLTSDEALRLQRILTGYTLIQLSS